MHAINILPSCMSSIPLTHACHQYPSLTHDIDIPHSRMSSISLTVSPLNVLHRLTLCLLTSFPALAQSLTPHLSRTQTSPFNKTINFLLQTKFHMNHENMLAYCHCSIAPLSHCPFFPLHHCPIAPCPYTFSIKPLMQPHYMNADPLFPLPSPVSSLHPCATQCLSSNIYPNIVK